MDNFPQFKIFNLFSHLKVLPKKEEDILSLELMGSTVSEIIDSEKAFEMRLIDLRIYIVKHNLYKRK